MKLQKLAGLSGRKSISAMHDIGLWGREVSSIQPMDMLIAHTQLKSRVGYKKADQIIAVIVDEIRLRVATGEIDHSPAANFSLPSKPVLMSEFLKTLKPFTLSERRAIIFAISTGKELSQVVLLKRADTRGSWQPFLADLLRSITPHIHCEYLFWHVREDGTTAPLMQLPNKFERETGMSWREFSASLGEIIMYMPPDSEELAVFVI